MTTLGETSATAAAAADAAVRHLYVHIPFCPKVCPYCSFYKETSDRNKTARFLDALLRELDQQAARLPPLRPRTIFFGGGTPSALSTPQLELLLSGLRARLDLSELVEWTLEMNPATVSLEKAAALRALGVNRISMGVQSWEPSLLAVLGRVHSAEQARRSYDILRAAGFDNVNLDLIFGVPTQTHAQWRRSLAETVALGPEHISAYNLTYEEDTEFFRRFVKGDFTQDDDTDAALFELTADTLSAAGYEPYEISNFSRPGRECLHNLAYWQAADYLGLGPSAFSTVGERRWANVRDTAAYNDRVHAGVTAADFEEAVPPETRRAEAIAFGLRTNRGVAAETLRPWDEQVAEFAALGLLRVTDADRVLLTRKGRLLADTVAEAFV
ncbi:MAG: radical SAM family heme chaperone HemW [Gluconacetobacter diazotrophicus]|nr:radical SAM family heme chaperone HemW [Gluconacetobacter diazotrophicus]